MKKILILCLTMAIALCALVSCVKTDNNNVNDNINAVTNNKTEKTYWQELVDNWCIVNYGDEWYGVITGVDEWAEGYITFTPTCREEGRFAGSVMASKEHLVKNYTNLNNE